MFNVMDEKVEQALQFIQKQLDIYSFDEIAVVNSFGKDSMVTQHLVMSLEPNILTLWIKEPFSPKETNEYAERMIREWNINIMVLTSLKEQDKKFMENIVYKPRLWKTNPELCCQLFKVEPVMSAVQYLKLKAWFSGMRKSESEKRGIYTQVWKQGQFTKLHPIIDFTEADIWRYLACHRIPVNPLYLEGYRSLGCEPCSMPNRWNSERGGRWADTMMEGGDCGIHCTPPYLE